ncbi:hypothetical protein HWV62_24864 [Athelia sp. TMB]|nr:hypothetical protein HWV62_24864 [Athelia sp. TMB]
MSTFAYAHEPMTDDLSSEDGSVDSSNHYHADLDEDLHPRHPHTAFSRSEGKPLMAIPDLRYEQSYMRSVKPYIHLEPRPEGHVAHAVKLDVVQVVDSERQIAKIEWGRLITVTFRDQVISPFLQGLIWGVASQYVRPFLSFVGSQVRPNLPSVPRMPGGAKEQGWWRAWMKGVGIATPATGHTAGQGTI